ncbi:MAG: TonB-dependent receptor [Saprospiraceae bacterium]
MTSLRLSAILFVSLAFLPTVTGQDTLLSIPTVEVVDDRVRHIPGQLVNTPDSLDRLFLTAGQLDDQLRLYPANHLRSYGPGRLTTLSSRGSGPGQQTVTLHGLNLVNPLWGLVDYSQIPLFFFPASRQLAGDQTSWIGTAGAAGVTALQTGLNSVSGSGLEAQSEVGSFGSRQIGLGAHLLVGEHTRALVRLHHQAADNDYPYTNLFGQTNRLPHAAFQQQGALLDATTTPGKHQEIGVTAWWQAGRRNIPPTLVQDRSDAVQEDLTARLLLRYQIHGSNWVGGIRTGYLDDRLHYVDPALGDLNDRTRSSQLASQVWAAWTPAPGHQLSTELGHRFIHGRSDNYTDPPDEHRYHLLVRYGWAPPGMPWNFWIAHRSETTPEDQAWSIPAAGAEYRLDQWLFRGQVSRHIRWPAWDDRFWNPGGNPDIRPEKGWAGELGTRWVSSDPAGKLSLDIQGFFRQVNDWVQWTPQSAGFWSPENLFAARSLGLESTIIWRPLANLRYTVRYAMARSIRQDEQEDLATNGRQLPYVPVHNLNQQIHAVWRGYAVRITYQWTDVVNTLADGSASLPAVHLVHADVAKSFHYLGHTWLVWARVENIFDHAYVLVKNYPLPGRQVHLGLRWTVQ